MLPTIWPGDTLLVESAPANEVSVGDIVLFGRDRRLFAHRVVAKDCCNGSQLVTRGDAMQVPDPVVEESELLGKVSYIVQNGKCIRPRRGLRSAERALATLMQRSEFAARVAVGVHGWLRESIRTT
jgi:signal peptidase I